MQDRFQTLCNRIEAGFSTLDTEDGLSEIDKTVLEAHYSPWGIQVLIVMDDHAGRPEAKSRELAVLGSGSPNWSGEVAGLDPRSTSITRKDVSVPLLNWFNHRFCGSSRCWGVTCRLSITLK